MNQLPPFEFHRAESVEAAVKFLNEARSEVKVIGGGTDLLANMKYGLLAPKSLLSLSRVSELFGIENQGERLRIGAMTPLRTLIDDGQIRRLFPVLRKAAAGVASPLIQNQGTVGGNLLVDTRCQYFNRSTLWRSSIGPCLKAGGDICHVTPGRKRCVAAFSSDLAGPLIALGAEVEIAGPTGRKMLPLAQLYGGSDGLGIHQLAKDEILVAIWLKNAETSVIYRKFRARGSLDFPYLAITARGGVGERTPPMIILTAIHFLPLRLPQVEGLLAGQDGSDAQRERAIHMALKAVEPLGTHPEAPGYRKRMVGVAIAWAYDELASGQPQVDGVDFDSTSSR